MTQTQDIKVFKHPAQTFLFMTTIIIVAAVGFFASDIYLPSLPAIGLYFHESNLNVQLTMTVFLLTMAVCQVFIGALSDKLGRKKVLIFFTCLFILASYGCSQAHTLNELILYRVFQGMGAASGLCIGQAIVADLYGPVHSAKPLSIVIPLVAFSPAIAPILGGIIEEHSIWRNIFLFLSAYGVLMLILIALPIIPKLPVQKKILAQNELAPNWKESPIFKIIKDKRFLGFALFMMNSNAIYFAFLSASPFLLKKFGYSPSEVGYAFCAASFPYMFASLIGRRLSVRYSHVQIIFLGLLMGALGVACMFGFAASHWPNILSILIPVFLICIGSGLIMPFSSASAISLYPQNAGLITGTLATLQLCAAAFGTFMMGLLANGTLYPLSFFDLGVVSFTILYFIKVFGKELRK